MLIGCSILAGFVLDMIFGDPHWLPHPVRWMGHAIALLEIRLRRLFPTTKNGERTAGAMLAIILPLCSWALAVLLLWLCSLVGKWLVLVVQSLLCYQVLAAKSLKVESMKVYHALRAGDIPGARYAVSMIVGRDTQSLDEKRNRQSRRGNGRGKYQRRGGGYAVLLDDWRRPACPCL